MKKKAIILGTLLLSASQFSFIANAATRAQDKVTITYAFWDKNQAPAIQNIVKAFEQQHPNIQVNVVVSPWAEYWTKLQAGAEGGTLPDVFWLNPSHFPQYVSNGMLMPLQTEVQAGNIKRSNFPNSIVQVYTHNGLLYGVPEEYDSIGLWYNKALFKQAHVAIPNDTWTWSTLVSAAQKLTNVKKGVWGIAAAEGDQENYFPTIYANGGYVISPDKKKSGYDLPATIGGIQFWTDLINKYHVSPTLQQMTDTTPLQLFESGKVAMIYGGSWDAVELSTIPYTKQNVDVTVLPKGKVRATITNPLGNVVAATTKHADEARLFVSFLGSKTAQQYLAGAVIPAFNGTQQAWVKSMPEFHLQRLLDEMKYAVPLPTSKETTNWRNLEPQYLNPAWTGSTPVATAAKALAQAMNQQLAQEQPH